MTSHKSGHYKEGIRYWEANHSEGKWFAIKVMDRHTSLLEKGDSLFPFLLEMKAKYPDAPDILHWLAEAYEKDDDYLKALQIYSKLIELYPAVEHYRKDIESCKAYIEADSMPESEETLQWLRNKINEIWK